MKTVFAPLADLDFTAKLNEAVASTQTGRNLLTKYRQYMLSNESSCAIVNKFLIEAKDHLFDDGVAGLFNTINAHISESLISWRLASACENIGHSNASFGYLNRNAAKQVEALLENNNEENVVKYIKAGALKNVMYCEAFRTIVNSVYKDASVVITENYTAKSPVSFTEINEGNLYFEALGHIYKITENNDIEEANTNEVSETFLSISRLVESGRTTFEGDVMTVSLPSATYTIEEAEGGCKCTRTGKKKNTKEGDGVKEDVTTFTDVEALREHNCMVVNATVPNQRYEMTAVLESIAKSFECFAQFAHMTNVKIVESMNDRFLVIENKDRMFAMALQSNHTNAWKVNGSVVESLNFIKERTHLDLTKDFQKNIEEAYANRSEEEKRQIQESIENDAMAARKAKIEKLTEAYKNNPEKLAVLSTIAAELNAL